MEGCSNVWLPPTNYTTETNDRWVPSYDDVGTERNEKLLLFIIERKS